MYDVSNNSTFQAKNKIATENATCCLREKLRKKDDPIRAPRNEVII